MNYIKIFAVKSVFGGHPTVYGKVFREERVDMQKRVNGTNTTIPGPENYL